MASLWQLTAGHTWCIGDGEYTVPVYSMIGDIRLGKEAHHIALACCWFVILLFGMHGVIVPTNRHYVCSLVHGVAVS